MPPYLEIHNQNLILMTGIGILLLFWFIFAAYGKVLSFGRSKHENEEFEKFPSGVREGHGKIPLFLIVLYIGLATWAFFYVMAHAFWGMEFNG